MKSSQEEAPRRTVRVLVVEDNAIIGMLYEDMLAEMGHSVCAIATTQAGAVAAAAQQKPDLLIVDASLREGSGVAAVQEILRGGFVPHIFVSGDVAGVLELMPGAIVVQKPILELDLARIIQRVLASPSAR